MSKCTASAFAQVGSAHAAHAGCTLPHLVAQQRAAGRCARALLALTHLIAISKVSKLSPTAWRSHWSFIVLTK